MEFGKKTITTLSVTINLEQNILNKMEQNEAQ